MSKSGRKKKPSNPIYKAAFVLFITFVVGIAIIVKAARVQLKEGDELKKLAEQQYYKFEVDEAARGNIITENGDLLATSVPIFDVYYDPLAEAIKADSVFNKALDPFCQELAKILPKRTANEWSKYIRDARNKRSRYLPIGKKISLENYNKLIAIGYPMNKGFTNEKSMSRVMPYGSLAFRTIGYVNEKDPDSTKHIHLGLEGAYDDVLKGKDGQQLVRVIKGQGRQPVKSESNRNGENGLDVITTIDVSLQDIAESTLRKRLSLHKADQGCVIIMDVKTGYIRAITSLQYDHEKDTCTESYNFAINGNYEPGSVFKLASILAYLDENPDIDIDKQDIFIGRGAPMKFGGRDMYDDHVVNKETGMVSIRQVIEQSSNIGTAKLITEQFGSRQDKFIKKLHSMNLGEKLNLDIAGEATPRVAISPGDKAALSRISIGYALTVAPIHLITFYNAIANDGRMMKPQFVKEIRKENITVEEFEPIVINKQIAKPRSIALAKSMMEGVVQNGTGKKLKDTPFLIAGKTGTARAVENGSYSRLYNTSFAGYFPADNPKYTCLVVISKARDRSQGWAASQISAPAFKDIVEKVYAIKLGIITDSVTTPNNGNVVHGAMRLADAKTTLENTGISYQNNVTGDSITWVKINKTQDGDTETIEIVDADTDTSLVPNFVGMNITDAVYLAERLGMKTTFSGHGNVKAQSIAPKTPIKGNETIELTLRK